MPFNHFMVDLETGGTDPSHAPILQIAAVAFDLEQAEVHPSFFDRCLNPPTNRFWSESTREWWASQPPHILQEICSRVEPPDRVLTDFGRWVLQVSSGHTPIMWAKPIHFEWPFLQSYYEAFGLQNPFFYAHCRDLRSVLFALGCEGLIKEIPFEGDEHNALHDVLHQVRVLFAAWSRESSS